MIPLHKFNLQSNIHLLQQIDFGRVVLMFLDSFSSSGYKKSTKEDVTVSYFNLSQFGFVSKWSLKMEVTKSSETVQTTPELSHTNTYTEEKK